MALTQMQLIQSLGEAMAWFEKELAWGVPPQELRHLCSRIGELYAALITNGQMATSVNQKGYDVVSGTGERISVKTTTMCNGSGHVSFNGNTIDVVDRVMVLRIDCEEMQVEILMDNATEEALNVMSKTPDGNGLQIALSKLLTKKKVQHNLSTVSEAVVDGLTIRELESGTIELVKDGCPIQPVLPQLRCLAENLDVSILNGNGNPLNTRQLGSLLIKKVMIDKET